MAKAGRQFEKDVWNFVSALAPNSEVLFDQKVKDKDTGQLRQVDAWINTKLGGHIPISILVSCKDHSRKVTITQIETFASERESTCASMGIIYSSSGFSKNALSKADSYSIVCCQLFKGTPSPLPQIITFTTFVCRPCFRISLEKPSTNDLKLNGITTWNDLFLMLIEESTSLIEAIEKIVHEAEKYAMSKIDSKKIIPPDWTYEITFTPHLSEGPVYKLKIYGSWRIYSARAECHLLKGSYCFKNKSFVGRIGTPAIDTWSAHPGPGWKEIKASEALKLNPRVVAIFSGGKVEDTFRQALGEKNIEDTLSKYKKK